ncbi:MAG: HAMP domain-containing histidine kinase, partial [Mucispirillum sp.]|nr:HAMP domain-containing histidine kinase [Mucispirillum sp.]
RDNGTGIDEYDIPNLFKPYFSKRQGGTGLGLAIVKKIVEEHSGTITAGNNEAGGAYFKIILPRGL